MIPQIDPKWYQKGFKTDMTEALWAQSTIQDVDFVCDILNLSKGERILDLACGIGRHSIELAKRGFQVVGVDISDELVNYARAQVKKPGINADFICSDIRNLSFKNEFDVILNLYDGAIGYLETDQDNLKIFKVISHSLKRGGKHIMHLPNTNFARKYFPYRTWRKGDQLIELLELQWDETTHLMVETTYTIRCSEFCKEIIPSYERRRIYELEELQSILASLNMKINHIYGSLDKDTGSSEDYDYISVSSIKFK